MDMKHIKQDFSLKAWVQSPAMDLGGVAKAKIKLFQNMVMLHIKFKPTTQKVKPFFSESKVVMLHIKLRGIEHRAP